MGQKRSRYIETVVNQFWERWRREYVITLRNWKQKYKRKNALIPEADDVVLVFEEKVPRQNWTLGRIINVIKGRDGEIRGAKVVGAIAVSYPPLLFVHLRCVCTVLHSYAIL